MNTQLKNEEPLWVMLRAEQLTPDELLTRFSISQPPIPVVELAAGMGVEVWLSDMKEDGALKMDLDQGEAVIYVNKEASENRMRFTVAHEIAHLMLHEFDGVIHRDAKGQFHGRVEREANKYAADLLMPEWMVRFAARQFGAMPRLLAPLFLVSEQAMTYRLQHLGFL